MNNSIALGGRVKDRPRAHRRTQTDAAAQDKPRAGLPWQARFFLVSLLGPWIITVGSLTLTLQRVALLALAVPALMRWLRGDAGRISMPDKLFFGFCLWGTICLFLSEGPSKVVQSGGILFLETFIPYLIARCWIRSAEDFRRMFVFLLTLAAILLPMALFETMTGTNAAAAFMRILPTYSLESNIVRAGFTRAQVVFEHPILFGMFAASLLSGAWLVAGQGHSTGQKFLLAALAAFLTLMSLSSAPVGAAVMQIGLVSWHFFTRAVTHRWILLALLVGGAAFGASLMTSRSLAEVYITYFTFDPATGWYRINIWTYGSASVWAHPLFGLGFGNWVHPLWMSDSIDNFWLVQAMRYGLPGVLMFGGGLVWQTVAIGRRHFTDPKLTAYQTAFIATAFAFFATGWTVHFWGGAYSYLLFLLGAGAWMIEAPLTPATEPPETGSASNRRSVSRRRQREATP